jgi:hypothetical protein
MAIGQSDLWLLHRLKTKGFLPDPVAVAEIGAQQVNESILENQADLEALGEAFGVRAHPPARSVGISDGRHALSGAPMTREIWQWLGVEYLAVDIDCTPDAVPLDLNCDDVPAEIRSRYSLVTNFGTTEHIANQSNAFKIIHDLTALDGIMIHNLPCHQPDHGLINYNPKFFWALARANDYRHVFTRLSPEIDPESIYIVLQKQHNLEFVTPLDVDDTAATQNGVLKQRYWTIFDKKALDKIAYSKEAALAQREREVFAREVTALGRECLSILKNLPFAIYVRRALARRYPWLVTLKHKVFPRKPNSP